MHHTSIRDDAQLFHDGKDRKMQKGFRLLAFLAMFLLSSSSLVRAQSVAPTYPVADPGFAYVDVNNDGMYNPAAGDIALTGARDIVALAAANKGVFNTQQSVGGYVAPNRRASLVIPASVSVDFTALNIPITLKAGLNILIYGTVTAPSLTLLGAGNGYHPSFNPQNGNCGSGSGYDQQDNNGENWNRGDGSSCGSGNGDDCNGWGNSCDALKCSAPVIGVECHQQYYSPGEIDLTGSTINFEDHFYAEAGGDILMNGSTITGYNDLSDITVAAGGNLYGNKVTNLIAGLFSYGNITLGATKGIYMDGAALGNIDSATTILLGSNGPVSLTNGSSITTYGGGDIIINSQYDKVSVKNSDLTGGNITCASAGNLDVSGSNITSTGSLTLQSQNNFYGFGWGRSSDNSGCNKGDSNGGYFCGTECWNPCPSGNDDHGGDDNCFSQATITATGAIITGTNMSVKSSGAIDLSGSVITLTGGALGVRSGYDQVYMDGASIIASGGIAVYARHDLLADNSKLTADQMIRLTSACGKVSAVSSVINPYSSTVTTTGVTVCAGEGGMDCDMANWTVPASIAFLSKSDISATNGTFDVTNPNGTISFTAYGGLIDVTNSTLTGTVSYSPWGVTVKK
jgi:hypothetical protein